MKQLFTIALATFVLCLVCAFVLPTNAEAAEATSGTCGADGDNLTWTLDDKGTLTISGTGEMRGYSDYQSVPWYSKCSSITKVVISDGVTSIGNCAFYGCSGLTSITIPDSVTSIGKTAFYRCSSLAYIVIPDSVKSIGDSAFRNCSSLMSVTIGNGVTGIGYFAFCGCSSLMSITIPDSVTSIGSCAFSGCSSLTSITIPDSVTSVGEEAFRYCSSLTIITIPDSVTSIGNGAFSECRSLKDVYITDIAAWLGVWFGNFNSNPMCHADNLYINGELVTEIVIPDGVTSIGSCAFGGYSSLTSITIPDSVTSIGNSAFSGCSSLTSITIPDSVTSIGSYAFTCCKIKYLTLPDIDIIEKRAFYKVEMDYTSTVSTLKKVFISAETVLIKQYAFGDDAKVTDIYYGGTEEQWAAVTILSGNGALSNATVHYNATGLACDGEHDWDDGVVTKEASCSENGERFYTCLCCGETKTETIEMLEHSYGDWVSDGDRHKHTCSVCGDEEIANHTWNKGKVTTQPTCKDEGEKTYTCTACGDTKTENIAKLTTHSKTEIRDAVAATDTTDGYTGDTYCKLCDKKLADGEVIPATKSEPKPTEPKPTEPESTKPVETVPNATSPSVSDDE